MLLTKQQYAVTHLYAILLDREKTGWTLIGLTGQHVTFVRNFGDKQFVFDTTLWGVVMREPHFDELYPLRHIAVLYPYNKTYANIRKKNVNTLPVYLQSVSL
jgi:hypothetical protein